MLPRAGLTVGTFFEKYIHRCIPSKLVSDVNLQREDSRVHLCQAAKSWTHCNIMRVMRMMMMTSSHFYQHQQVKPTVGPSSSFILKRGGGGATFFQLSFFQLFPVCFNFRFHLFSSSNSTQNSTQFQTDSNQGTTISTW